MRWNINHILKMRHENVSTKQFSNLIDDLKQAEEEFSSFCKQYVSHGIYIQIQSNFESYKFLHFKTLISFLIFPFSCIFRLNHKFFHHLKFQSIFSAFGSLLWKVIFFNFTFSQFLLMIQFRITKYPPNTASICCRMRGITLFYSQY